jgi:hypothetical protein
MRCYRYSTHREPRVRLVQSFISLRTLSTSDFRRRDISSAIEWSSVLRLATRWDIKSIQSLALEELHSLATPLDKLVLARELDILAWLEPAYVALCLRKEPLTMAEAERLSMADVVSIFTVQQLVQTAQLPATVDDVSRHVRSVFQLPLASPPAADEGAYNSCTREVSASPYTHDVSCPLSPAPAPVHVDYSPEVLRKALDDAEHDRAVDLLSEQNLLNAFAVILSWANTSPQVSERSPIQDFICAVFRRAVCDGSFVTIAVQLLSRLNRDVQDKVFDAIITGSKKWDYYRPHGSALITQFTDAAVTWALRWIPSQSSCSPVEATGRVIYRYEEHWLSDAVFLSRLNNAAAL